VSGAETDGTESLHWGGFYPDLSQHLSTCDANLRRAQMTDDEFDTDVARSLSSPSMCEDDTSLPGSDWDPPQHESLDLQPCPECGEAGPCGYDALGRPLIHPTRTDDD
jgi:hypothetical protein